jgi:hypothetical protein
MRLPPIVASVKCGRPSGRLYARAPVSRARTSNKRKCTKRWLPRPAARLTFACANATRGAINLRGSVLGAVGTLLRIGVSTRRLALSLQDPPRPPRSAGASVTLRKVALEPAHRRALVLRRSALGVEMERAGVRPEAEGSTARVRRDPLLLRSCVTWQADQAQGRETRSSRLVA